MIGIDTSVITKLSKELALKRIKRDTLTDFIFAPHFNVIYEYAHDELFDQLSTQLRSGKYTSRLPIVINVIKSNGFCRPGAILEPKERIVYQLLVDYLAPQVEHEIDRNCVFSNRLLIDDSEGYMFEKSSESYNKFQYTLKNLSSNGEYNYVLKADIASFFERIYQHVIGNLLYSANADSKAISFLEKFLLSLSQNDSHGILQGLFPSDFLGNFGLCSIDAQNTLEGINFARYVDDIYLFFKDEKQAKRHKIKLIEWLRKDGLTLNEYKTKIYNVDYLLNEETELDRLFEDAKESAASDIAYESNLFWDFDVTTDHKDEVELRAVQQLIDYPNVDREKKLKIERFCLPIFSASGDDYAVDHVLKVIHEEPSMSQIYNGYLRGFVKENNEISGKVEQSINSENILFDYQKLWLYSTLLYSNEISANTIRFILEELRRLDINECVRAICAILIGKHGSASYRRILRNHYSNEPSEYVRSAILYSAQYLPAQEKDTCFKAWSGHSFTNALIVNALKKK